MSCHRLYHLPVAWGEGLDLETIQYLLREGQGCFHDGVSLALASVAPSMER